LQAKGSIDEALQISCYEYDVLLYEAPGQYAGRGRVQLRHHAELNADPENQAQQGPGA